MKHEADTSAGADVPTFRRADGSFDIEFYLSLGRQIRSTYLFGWWRRRSRHAVVRTQLSEPFPSGTE
jgi:hypothetical protein